MAQLDTDADVFVLDLGAGDNRFNPDAVAELHQLLDRVDAAPAPKALVTTATGKIWSNGLDLDWIGGDPARLREVVEGYQPLLGRVLTLGAPTVAAIQGHVFAGGALFALAHDHRVMRADRGYFCLPEIDLHMSFTAGMSSLVTAKLRPEQVRDAAVFGRRYGGAEALEAGIVDAAVDADDVLPRAIAIASGLTAKAHESMAGLKRGIYHTAFSHLRGA